MNAPRFVVLALLVAGGFTPALAHHRQTPPIIQFTSAGDVSLPRVPALGRKIITFETPSGSGTQIVTAAPYKDPSILTPIGPAGDNQNPSISFTGTTVAWDTDTDPTNSGLPGRQIALARRGTFLQGPADPTGTSGNPSLDVGGTRVMFESTGDLAGTGNAGVRQVFLRSPGGVVTQVSTGLGAATNPVLSPKKHLLAFQSTSDPVTGLDTGVSQIWMGGLDATQPPAPLTNGLADSTRPSFSDDGAVVAFESRADLADDQSDMGVPQIFIYHVKSHTFAQITREPGGCTTPAAARAKRDWRVGFVCGGTAYVYMLRADTWSRLQTNGGNTTAIVPALGVHFYVVATTGDLATDGSPTAGHQIYQVNSFKRPLEAVDLGYVADWFPFRGLPPAK
jgi:hypothetical protein